MGEKCKPYYRNLNTIQSYSEQKYATVQWCEQNCENDEWLKQQVDQLRYLTPPAVRQSWNINDFIDFKNSYGVSSLGANQVGFSNGGHRRITINFDEDDEIKVDESYTQNNCDKQTKDIIDSETLDSDGNPTKTHKTWYQLPVDISQVGVEKKYYGTTKDGSGSNTSWHISFDKAKNYYVRPDWLKNWKDGEIPSVVRAQTFKNLYDGYLVQLDLGLDWSGAKSSSTGSPLYIQIWKTYNKLPYVKKWNNDKDKKCMEYVYKKKEDIDNYTQYKDKYDKAPTYEKKEQKVLYKKGKNKGKPKKYPKGHKKAGQEMTETVYKKSDKGEYVRVREKLAWLGHNHYDAQKKKWASDRYYPLAETKYKYSWKHESFPSIKFDKKIELKKDETYAIVLYSPLSEYKHCPRWRGWGRNCRKDKVYTDGCAWLSTNNGRTWVRYGKDGVDTITNSKGKERELTYKEGRYTPQDFMFQCHIETKGETVKNYRDGIHYLYFEPIYDNPIREVTINAYGMGLKETVNQNIHVNFDINTSGDDGGWQEDIELGQTIVLTKDNQTGEYPNTLVVRAKMWHDEGYNETPTLDQVIIDLETEPSKEFYARSIGYTPRTTAMLGANIWGRLYAPFDYDAEVECNVEIIQGEPHTEYFDIINPSSLAEYMENVDMDNSAIVNLDNVSVVSYLENHTDLIDDLKAKNIYLRPFVETNNTMHLLSFSNSYKTEDMVIRQDSNYTDAVIYPDFLVGGITFSNEVAFPIQSVELQPVNIEQSNDNPTPVDTYKEFLDFNFDYETNQLIFKDGVIDELTDGKLSVTYNPIFISRLNREDVGRRIDVETGNVEEGLILDYFKETITITDEHIQNRTVDLRVKPVDPIREVLLYKYNRTNVDDYIKLHENVDYELVDSNTSKKNSLVFAVNSMDNKSSVLSEGDTLEVVYTPSLTDNTLYVGYFAKRNNTSMQCRLQNMYWEYKV